MMMLLPPLKLLLLRQFGVRVRKEDRLSGDDGSCIYNCFVDRVDLGRREKCVAGRVCV